MRIRVIGGGVYGCHLALSLINDGHDVEIHEIASRLFNGASGNGPARGHRGFHYPRSRVTQLACQEHVRQFEDRYGHLTHGIRTNIYAIARDESLIDFGAYKKVLQGDVEFLTVERPEELGPTKVEGALMTGERHFVVDKARDWFTAKLDGRVQYGRKAGVVDDASWDFNIDCTFCANDEQGVDRFEACLTVLLEGPVDRSITIMDGRLPGIYVWNEDKGLTSVTSARYTPMARFAKWHEARQFLDTLDPSAVRQQSETMVGQMAAFYPRIRDEYRIVGHLLAVRALPFSAADSRLVDVIRVGERAARVRAGKIDAIFQAEEIIKTMLAERTNDRHSGGRK